MLTSTVKEFHEELCQAGLAVEESSIRPDGRIRRVWVKGHRTSSRNGWFQLFPNGHGRYGDWKTDTKRSWGTPTSGGSKYDNTERLRTDAGEEATRVAQSIWDNSSVCFEHAYLSLKGIAAHGIRQRDGELVIPIFLERRISSLQFISEKGKRFLKGGIKRGGCFILGNPKSHILVTEGFATAASLYECTEIPCAVAFDAGNLLPACENLRKQFPGIFLILCGDNDRKGAINVGKIKAEAAAKAFGNGVILPPDEIVGSDFNDFHTEHGKEAVRTYVTNYLGHQSLQVEDVWPDPIPLPNPLPNVDAFDLEALPSTVRPYVEDVAERMQCPPDYTAVSVMVGLGAVVGRQIGIRPQANTDWVEVPNLWGMIIGRPGVMKSPAMVAGIEPLKSLQRVAAEAHEAALKEFSQSHRRVQIRNEEREKQFRKNCLKDSEAELTLEDPQQPQVKRYMVNDATLQALAEVIRHNQNGVLLYRDELVSFLKHLDREENAEARGFLLSSWSGKEFCTVDRIARGLNLHIPFVCLSILGSTQPGRIERYLQDAVHGASNDDGLIQRFGLMVWPDMPKNWKDLDRLPNEEQREILHSTFKRLSEVSSMGLNESRETDGLPFLRFAPPALERFQFWREQLEVSLRSEELHPALESHFSKYRKLIPALALVTHLADGDTGPVSDKALAKALLWETYLKSHAMRAYSSVGATPITAAKSLWKRVLRKDLDPVFTERDVYRKHWAGLSEREAVEKATATLVEHDYLISKAEVTRGRPKRMFEVNPKALQISK